MCNCCKQSRITICNFVGPGFNLNFYERSVFFFYDAVNSMIVY